MEGEGDPVEGEGCGMVRFGQCVHPQGQAGAEWREGGREGVPPQSAVFSHDYTGDAISPISC